MPAVFVQDRFWPVVSAATSAPRQERLFQPGVCAALFLSALVKGKAPLVRALSRVAHFKTGGFAGLVKGGQGGQGKYRDYNETRCAGSRCTPGGFISLARCGETSADEFVHGFGRKAPTTLTTLTKPANPRVFGVGYRDHHP